MSLPPQVRPVALQHASRLLNPGPTVMITTAHGGQRNVMSAAWSMPVEFTPPRVAVVIDKSTVTRQLLLASGQLALNLPGPALADACYTVGQMSLGDPMLNGRDKFEAFGLPTFAPEGCPLPLIEGCLGWLLCRRIPEPHTESAYDTFFVEVTAAWADERAFAQGHWKPATLDPRSATLHHRGAGLFAVSQGSVQARALTPPQA